MTRLAALAATLRRFFGQYAFGIAIMLAIALLAYLADWLTSGVPALLGR